MKSELRLFIGEHEVELTDNPAILYSYTVDDFSNPTAVKNSFSKTITIQGTPKNNQIFGSFFSVERVCGNSAHNSGVDFNASKKAPFTIFINGEVYESGYVKLQKVNTINDTYTYDIGLFGGLGDYFYNLTYNGNTGGKLRLSDLDYGGGEHEFDFTVTADTVYDAWQALGNNTDGVWQKVNFIPAYNGVPADFDSNKVIINTSGTSLPKTVKVDNTYYTATDGMVCAELPENLTEWEMRDLRSYNQRPCFRVKTLIDACANVDNSGYEVDLDPDFFNSDNPYYEKTWITLPMMKNLEYTNEEQVLENSELIGLTTTGNVDTLAYQDLRFVVGEFGSTTPSNITLNAQVFINNPIDTIGEDIDPALLPLLDIEAPYTSFAWFWNRKGDSYHTGWWCMGSLFVQLIALNGDVVVGASDAYNLTSPVRHNGKLYYGYNGYYSESQQYKPYLNKNILNVLGTFQRDGFHYEGSNSVATLPFTISNLNSPVSALKMVFHFGATDDKLRHFEQSTFFPYTEENSWIDFGGPDPMPRYSLIGAYPLTVGVQSTNFKAVLAESLGRSGTKVTKNLLLNTEASPAEYLLSYCKMFGLYFRKEKNENIIHIETRKTFYDRSTIVNLNDFIDRSKDTTINPIVFDTKWYEMYQEGDETEWAKKYKSGKGIDYGCRMIDTGYEFSVDKKSLYEKSTIRSGIEGLERSKYFVASRNDNIERSWMGMGLHYNLYDGTNATSVDAPIRNNSDFLGLNLAEGMRYYDLFPKLQFHGTDNAATDGNNVLVFFSGMKTVNAGRTNQLTYYLSDDNPYQTLLNDSTPCWLFTAYEYKGERRLCKRVTSIPVFERYLTNANSGKVDRSLDFGTPQELFIPDYNIEETANIYSNFWKTYIEDLFDPDTKVLTCFVLTKGSIGSDWLRRFYWFDNAIWRLNEITDWDIASFGTTKMQFVKVQDVGDYTSVTQTKSNRVNLTSNKYRVIPSGETATLTITVDNGGEWRLAVPTGVVASRTNGTGNGTVTVTLPANNSNLTKYWYFNVSTRDNAQARVTITQSYDGETDYTLTPSVILLPASSGMTSVSTSWRNRGDDYLQNVSVAGGSLSFSADITTYADDNLVVLSRGANSTGEALNNYCTITSYEGISKTLLLDQLPLYYHFEKEGGTAELRLRYNTVTVNDLPFWATVSESTDGDYTVYTFTILPNYYETHRTAGVSLTNQEGMSANLSLSQEAGNGGGSNEGVRPQNLYYDASGGTQYLSINLSHPWSVTATTGGFFSLSQSNGDGQSVVGVVVGENSGSALTGTIDIKDLSTNTTYTVTVSQDGASQARSITVSPLSTNVPQSGGNYTVTVTYTGRNGDYVSVSADTGLSYSPLSWVGDVATTTVTVDPNTAASTVSKNLTFSATAGSAVTVFSQAATTEAGSVAEPSVTIPQSGGTLSDGLSANTPWTATTSDAWVSVSPTSGTGNTNLTISGTANTSLSARTGYVYIDAIGSGSRLATIEVYQPAFVETLSVSPTVLTFDTNGGTATFTITSNTNWTIE